MKRLVPALLVAVAATSCGGPQPTPIAFADHPSVLRGTWTGALTRQDAAEQPLRLELAASYETSRQYRVSGNGSLGSGAVTVTGSVTGGSVHSYLQPQYSPANQLVPERARLTVQPASGDATKLDCQSVEPAAQAPATPAPVWTWNCSSGSNTLVLKRMTP
ncbi:hypothetical protein [Deinococcus arenicola]|uniref:Lipoprotein n=1 Tax=Deinococcus arenicola TaxID=2994950 RepID=A0ABU4DPR0_9DEIO|nr:hypothetical protein [Deinococcus sp. ZS9-10]MDV6374406.1 hypothetical protein [Deinococcus sp. ZS9-10]